MEVILKETIETLGEEGEIVKVKPGYGRNYLLPYQKAVLASPANLALLEKEKATIEARRLSQRQDAEAMAKKVAGVVLTFAQRVGEEGRLFGSVTSADISAKLGEMGIEIDKKKILLDDPIKTLGEQQVSIKVGYQMNAEVKVDIVPLAAE